MESLDDHAMGSDELTSVAKSALIKSRPWMLFLAILGFIYVAFMVLATLISLVSGDFSALFNVITIGISGYLYWMLLKSAQGIKRFAADNSSLTLEETLLHYKNYWMVSGILIIFVLALMVLGFFASLIGVALL